MRDHASYVAHVTPSGTTLCVYADDWERPVAVIDLPDGASIRATLEDAGWRLTGRQAPSGGLGTIYVEPIQRDV